MALFDFLSPITAAISGGAQIAATNATNQANIQMNKENNALQMQLAQYSYDQQKEMIRQQNEYNSPANQMQRYIDAGLNPNLIYGQISSGNQSEIAKYNTPSTNPSQQSDFDMLQVGRLVMDSIAQMKTLEMADQRIANEKLDNEAKFLGNEFQKHLAGLPSIYDDKDMDTSLNLRSAYQKAMIQENQIYKQNSELALKKLQLQETESKLQEWLQFHNLRKSKLELENEKTRLNNRVLQYSTKGLMSILGENVSDYLQHQSSSGNMLNGLYNWIMDHNIYGIIQNKGWKK